MSHILTQLSRRAVRARSRNELVRDVVWLAHAGRGLEALGARWLAELDRRPQGGPHELADHCVELLQLALHATSGAAHAQLRTARLLDRRGGSRKLAGVSGGNCQSSLGPPGARVWLGTSPEPRRGRRRRA
jgi:hypothetical protein